MYSEKFKPEHCTHTCNPGIQKLKQEDCPKSRDSLCYSVSTRSVKGTQLSLPWLTLPLIITPHKEVPIHYQLFPEHSLPRAQHKPPLITLLQLFCVFFSLDFSLTPGEQELCPVHYSNHRYICFASTMDSHSTRCFPYNSVNIIAIMEQLLLLSLQRKTLI